jgi:hypothetical protein
MVTVATTESLTELAKVLEFFFKGVRKFLNADKVMFVEKSKIFFDS